MKCILIYDSQYGNTEKIAQAIRDALAEQAEVTLIRVADFKPEMLAGVELLVVGSPTQGFKPTAAIKDFLKAIPAGQLKGMRVVAFDTRFTQKNIDKTPVLPVFVKMFGYAADPIAKALHKGGGQLVVPPEGFYVVDTEGPLVGGELDRAAVWARKLSALSQVE
jgi:flavodoxin